MVVSRTDSRPSRNGGGKVRNPLGFSSMLRTDLCSDRWLLIASGGHGSGHGVTVHTMVVAVSVTDGRPKGDWLVANPVLVLQRHRLLSRVPIATTYEISFT
ncbi:hypothetical protein GQ457_04G008050 [Hibiscus cannabinus]